MGKVAVSERDGLECFYCGEPLDLADATVEHLLPLSLGGNNNDANLALAHQACNHDAGAMSIVEKVRLRDKKRQSDEVKIERITKTDPGELLLAVATNAQHLTPEVQNVIARFMDLQTAPKMVIKATEVNL